MVHHGARGRNLAADQPPELHGNGLAVWQTPGPAPTNVPAKVYGRQISQSGGVRAQDLAVLRRALRQHRHHPVGGHLRGLAAEHGPLADPGPLRPMTSSARRVDPQVITSATKGLENPADHMTGRNARICMSAPSARRLGRRDDIPDIGTRAH